MSELRFVVEGAPLPWQRAGSVNGRRYTPKEQRAYQERIRWSALQKLSTREWNTDGRFVVELDVYVKDERRRDLDNFAKQFGDAGNKLLWADDSAIVSWDLRKHVDRERPRVEVRVIPTEEGQHVGSDNAGVVFVMIGAVTIPQQRKRKLGDVTELAKSIRDLGLLNPITLTTDHTLISGLHRLEACRALGWKHVAAHVVALEDLDRELAEIDENLIRNDLTVLERAEHLARRKEIYEAKNPTAPTKAGRPRKNADRMSAFTEDTAAKTNVSPRTIRREVLIARDLDHSVRDAIRDHEKIADSKTELMELARLPVEEQHEAVARVVSGEAKDIRSARNLIKRDERLATIQQAVGFPEGTFAVIAADPPWAYNNSGFDQSAGGHYETLPAEEIAARWKENVERASTQQTVLFLWATSPLLPEGLMVMREWGFSYKASLIWTKDRAPGIGWWVATKHELLLVGVRESSSQPITKVDSVIHASVAKHSQKPEVFYEAIERMYPINAERPMHLELFARRERRGWARGLYNQELAELAS